LTSPSPSSTISDHAFGTRGGLSARPSTIGRRASRSTTCRISAATGPKEYDWRTTEARLNALPQFRTEIDGLAIHFVHVRSPQDDALPLVITHGWPGSIVEFLKVIGPLTDPTAHGDDGSDAFHVVCPSLPGFGFSDKPTQTGWGIERISDAWAVLMARLGYERYGALGSDWGTSISSLVGQRDREHVIGIHLTPPSRRRTRRRSTT
jgi:epoxide hydrolase